MQLLYSLRGAVWILVYLLFILAPLFALLAGSHPPPRDFWTEFSVALGYTGLAMMGLQFGLTARFRYVTEPWGEDVIYTFSPSDFARGGQLGRSASGHSGRRSAGIARAVQYA
jgi:predicted ferric reductase